MFMCSWGPLDPVAAVVAGARRLGVASGSGSECRTAPVGHVHDEAGLVVGHLLFAGSGLDEGRSVTGELPLDQFPADHGRLGRRGLPASLTSGRDGEWPRGPEIGERRVSFADEAMALVFGKIPRRRGRPGVSGGPRS